VTERELACRVERAEVDAWADAVAAATPEIARPLGLRVEPVCGGIALIASEVPSVLYNRAFGFALDAPLEEPTLDRAIALYRRDLPFAIQPSPAAQPIEIRDWLEARGLHARFNWVRWVRDDRPIPEARCDLAIAAIGPEQAGVFVDLVFQIFDEPAVLGPWLALAIGRRGWTHYLSHDGSQPVGVGALYVAGGVGWLGWGGTLKSHRGRGGQSAMLVRRVRDAIAQGCRVLTVETAEDPPEKPNPSYRNVERAGFRVLHLRPSHAHFPAEKTLRQDG
jgi:hypothetical protein